MLVLMPVLMLVLMRARPGLPIRLGPLACLGLLLGLGLPLAAARAENERRSSADLNDKLVSIGSDTLGSLSSQWAEELRRRYPGLLMQVRAIGSGAAPTALIQGTADLGPMSRPMSLSEERAFVRRFGYGPTAVAVARDEIAVFVHRDNALAQIAVPRLDAVFSATRRCGYRRPIRDWRRLDGAADDLIEAPARPRPISLYGRSASSGTYSFFRRQVLCRGDFAPELNRLVGSSAVVRAVARDPLGVGYASAGYLNANVKRLRLLAADGVSEVALSRSLYVYINRRPQAPLGSGLAAFLDLVLSAEGQRAVRRSGYLPLSAARVARLRQSLGLSRD